MATLGLVIQTAFWAFTSYKLPSLHLLTGPMIALSPGSRLFWPAQLCHGLSSNEMDRQHLARERCSLFIIDEGVQLQSNNSNKYARPNISTQ